MVFWGKRFTVFVLCIIYTVHAFSEEKSGSHYCVRQSYPTLQRLTFRYNSKEGLGLQDVGYSTLEYFLAKQEIFKGLVFLDLKGHIFDDGKWAANGGIGFRYRQEKFPVVFGMHSYYDYRRNVGHNFHQVGLGLEFLADIVKVYCNGYIPLGDKTKLRNVTFDAFIHNHMRINSFTRLSMYGADLEVEVGMCKRGFFEVFTAWGPYYYRGNFGKDAFGVQGRLGSKYKNFLKVDVKGTYDRLFKLNIQGEFALYWNFGKKVKARKAVFTKKVCCTNEAYLLQRLAQPVQRQEIIVLSDQTKKQIAHSESGDPLFFLFVNNSALSGNLGTFEQPFTSLALAQNSADVGDFIYIFPGDGSSNGLNSGFILQDEQSLLGASTNQLVTTNLAEVMIPAQFLGSLPLITNPLGLNIIELANGNTISGLHIDSAIQHGINGSSFIRGSTIKNNVITDSGTNDAGIFLNMDPGIQLQGDMIIKNNTITSTNGGNDGVRIDLSGIAANPGRLNLQITSNNLSNLTSEGISITRTTGTQSYILAGSISDNQLQGNSAQGINIVHGGAASGIFMDMMISNNSFFGNGAEGIQMNRARGTLSIKDNIVRENGGTAGVEIVLLGAETLNIDVVNNQFIDNTPLSGFLIDTNSTSFARMNFSQNQAFNGDVFTFSEDGASILEVNLGKNEGALIADPFTLIQ